MAAVIYVEADLTIKTLLKSQHSQFTPLDPKRSRIDVVNSASVWGPSLLKIIVVLDTDIGPMLPLQSKVSIK